MTKTAHVTYHQHCAIPHSPVYQNYSAVQHPLTLNTLLTIQLHCQCCDLSDTRHMAGLESSLLLRLDNTERYSPANVGRVQLVGVELFFNRRSFFSENRTTACQRHPSPEFSVVPGDMACLG